MDWVLAITTLVVNSGLGWLRGSPWAWLLHAVNNVAWVVYMVFLDLWGLVVCASVGVIVDLYSAYRAGKRERDERTNTDS